MEGFGLKDEKRWNEFARDYCMWGVEHGLDDEGSMEFCIFCHHPDFKGDVCRFSLCPLAGKDNHFKKFGFDCLIVWEKELKNISKLKEKLKNFAEA